jgi:hypothetical protein
LAAARARARRPLGPEPTIHELQFCSAPTLQICRSRVRRQEVARQLQETSYRIVTQVHLGPVVSPVAYRNTISDIVAIPEVIPFWNMKRARKNLPAGASAFRRDNLRHALA